MKNSFSNKPVGRREFLRGGVRYGLLAGLGALVARTFLGRKGNQSCTNQGICRSCPDYTGCELPQALSAKESGMTADLGGAFQEIRRIESIGSTARQLEIGPDDKLYVAAANAVYVLSMTGEREHEITLNAPVRCVAAAGDGTIYAGTRNRIDRFDSKGNCTASWDIPGNRTWVTGLAVTENDLFIADAGNRIVLRYDLSGKLVRRIGKKDEERNIPGFVVPSPYLSVKMHPDGLLRVNNFGRHRVEAYTVDGDFEGAWGKASLGLDGFCGCCNPIRFAILPDGSVVTCEKGKPRVKIYSATGEYKVLVAGSEAFPENALVGSGTRDIDVSLAGLAVAVDSKGQIAILDHVLGEIRIMQPKA